MQGDTGLLFLKLFSCVLPKPEVAVPAPHCLYSSIKSGHEDEDNPKRFFWVPPSLFI